MRSAGMSRPWRGTTNVDELEIDEKRPSFHIRCSGDERIEAAFLAAYIGLKQLEATRPDAITVKSEGI